MKRLSEMTSKEVYGLRSEDVKKELQMRLIENGLPIDILDRKCEELKLKEPEKEEYAYEITPFGIHFDSQEKAKEVADLIRKNGGYETSWEYLDTKFYRQVHTRKEGDQPIEIRMVRICDKKEAQRIKKENESILEKYNKLKTSDEDIEKANDIKNEIDLEITRKANWYRNNMRLYDIFEEYMDLVDGDKDKAIKLMEVSYTFNDETEKYILGRYEREQEENKDAVVDD